PCVIHCSGSFSALSRRSAVTLAGLPTTGAASGAGAGSTAADSAAGSLPEQPASQDVARMRLMVMALRLNMDSSSVPGLHWAVDLCLAMPAQVAHHSAGQSINARRALNPAQRPHVWRSPRPFPHVVLSRFMVYACHYRCLCWR